MKLHISKKKKKNGGNKTKRDFLIVPYPFFFLIANEQVVKKGIVILNPMRMQRERDKKY